MFFAVLDYPEPDWEIHKLFATLFCRFCCVFAHRRDYSILIWNVWKVIQFLYIFRVKRTKIKCPEKLKKRSESYVISFVFPWKAIDKRNTHFKDKGIIIRSLFNNKPLSDGCLKTTVSLISQLQSETLVIETMNFEMSIHCHCLLSLT